MEIPNKPTLGFFEWLEIMRSHSCPNCQHGAIMMNLNEMRIPVGCAECYAGYSQYVIVEDMKNAHKHG
jgi:protein-arginine kinase activator protein McsA